MKKEAKLIILGSLIFLVVIFLIMTFFYLFSDKGSQKGISGFASEGSLESSAQQEGDYYKNIPKSYIFLLILLWFVLLMALVFIFVMEKKKINKEIVSLNIPGRKEEFDTNIDLLADVIEKEGNLKVSTLSKAFNVKKEVILNWARTLESGDIATVEYPFIGEPYIKLNEENRNKIPKNKD